jgi:hypothetical protein
MLSPTPHYYEIKGRAAEIARALGRPVGGAEHLFLAMLRNRETVPARALAGLADLDALDAVVVEAANAPVRPHENAVFLPAAAAGRCGRD